MTPPLPPPDPDEMTERQRSLLTIGWLLILLAAFILLNHFSGVFAAIFERYAP